MHFPQARECNSESWMLLIFLCILRFLLHDYYCCLFLAVNLQMIESVVKVKWSMLTGLFIMDNGSTIRFAILSLQTHSSSLYSYDKHELCSWKDSSLRKQTADIWRRHRWFAGEMMSEKLAQKFHTGGALTRNYGSCFWVVVNLLHPIRSNTQMWVVARHHLVWDFCAHSADVILLENQWLRRENVGSFFRPWGSNK